MIQGQTCLGVIVARGGSKGLPGKNLADLGGRPLVAWSVAAARESACLDRTILSSDDDAIIAAGRAAGCDVPFRRPARLATDNAPVDEVILHALDACEEQFDIVVLLPATSPLRVAGDIDACITACAKGAPAVVSVCATAKPAEWLCTLTPDQHLRQLLPGKGLHTRRQDLQPAYLPNGAVYVAWTDWFREHMTFYTDETVGCEMPRDRSIDIDDPTDLIIARSMVASAGLATIQDKIL